MMLYTLASKIKVLVLAFKVRVLTDLGLFESETCLETQLTQIDNQSILDSTSLIVTPNGYKETKLYSVVPSDASGDMSVTRATTATRVNSEGFIETVPYNLFLRSEEFDNVYWVKQRASITQNAILAPNQTMTADNLIATNGVTYAFTGALGVNVLSNSFTLRSTVTLSFYLKYNGLNRVRVMYGTSTNMSNVRFVEVDLQVGIITSQSATLISNPFIQDVGSGWYRVGFTTVMDAASNMRLGVGLGDSVKTVANGIDGVYVWGAQLVDGSQDKTYLPVSTSFNIPRLDYSNGSCPSILVEPQRINQLLQSESLNTTPWGVTEVSVTSNVTTSPSNLLNADKIQGSGVLGPHQVSQTGISYVSGNSYTFSFYIKKDTNDFIQISLPGAIFSGNRFANFDINTGVTGLTSANVTTSIVNVGNGWYRCITTSTATTSLSSTISIFLITSLTSVRNESNTLTTSVFLWGGQIEIGTNVSSYIPTTTTTVTRNSDVISNSTATSLIGQTQGTIFLDFYYKSTNIDFLIFISESITNYLFRPRITNNAFGVLYLSTAGGMSSSANFTNSVTLIPNARNKIVVTYDGATLKTRLFCNGLFISERNLPAILPLNQSKIDIGNSFSSNVKEFNNVSLWKTQITDAQAIQLTTL